MKQYFFLLLLVILKLPATEFMYLVGKDDQSEQSYFMHQKEQSVLKLYQYDGKAKEYNVLLPYYFTPCAFRLLPQGNGFSFVQNDSVYIKNFAKRSPKRIEFFEPLYAINAIEWQGENRFCFSAKQHGHYGIYESNLEGDVTQLFVREKECMYPQNVKQSLFYISRDEQQNYCVIERDYHLGNEQAIAGFNRQPLVCLSMISEHEGFCLGYPDMIRAESDMIWFSYYYLKKSIRWQSFLLFNFSIPKKYLTDEIERAYESIVPFLPYYEEEKLYFSSFCAEEDGRQYNLTYDLNKKKIVKKVPSSWDSAKLVVPYKGEVFEEIVSNFLIENPQSDTKG